MAFNKNELIIDRVRSVSVNDLTTKGLLFRLTQIEDPSLNCTAEGEEVTDAVGAVITTMYRSKKATFGASNSLISLDLAAAQYGTKKVLGSETEKITVPTYEVLDIKDGAVTLSNVPTNEIKYIYTIKDGEIGETFEAGAAASDTAFVVDAEGKTITTPTGLEGKVYVEYEYETENAVYIRNNASEFPEAVSVVIYVIFRDKCNENIKYSGRIVCPKAKLNPESIELALTSEGKHAFEFTMMKDYCADEGEDELFHIVVAE